MVFSGWLVGFLDRILRFSGSFSVVFWRIFRILGRFLGVFGSFSDFGSFS